MSDDKVGSRYPETGHYHAWGAPYTRADGALAIAAGSTGGPGLYLQRESAIWFIAYLTHVFDITEEEVIEFDLTAATSDEGEK